MTSAEALKRGFFGSRLNYKYCFVGEVIEFSIEDDSWFAVVWSNYLLNLGRFKTERLQWYMFWLPQIMFDSKMAALEDFSFSYSAENLFRQLFSRDFLI